MDVTISKFGSRSFFRLNGESIEIKDYKISSSMHGSTEDASFLSFMGPSRMRWVGRKEVNSQ